MAVDFAAAQTYALERITHDVPVHFCYHGVAHTRDDVLPAAVRLGECYELGADEMLLVQTAALFHDIGFVADAETHEAVSAAVAGEMLPRWGYSAEQIAIIQQMIRATRLPQSPTTLLDEILCDADLEVLGRADFLSHNLLLYAEMYGRGKRVGLATWYVDQADFLRTHRYHTEAARLLCRSQKQRNVNILETLATRAYSTNDASAR